MQIELWGDVICPFCYMAKRNFDIALEKFLHIEEVELVWRSFQLLPRLKTQDVKHFRKFSIGFRSVEREEVLEMRNNITRRAHEVGLDFHLNKTIPANSFKAHRLLHFARGYSKQNEATDALFDAYFSYGKNIDDDETLLQLGRQIGLPVIVLKSVLENDNYSAEVHKDIREAKRLGIRSVPFFVFDRTYVIRGSQDTQVFSTVLVKSYNEWIKREFDKSR